jgi:hypothetical protein
MDNKWITHYKHVIITFKEELIPQTIKLNAKDTPKNINRLGGMF